MLKAIDGFLLDLERELLINILDLRCMSLYSRLVTLLVARFANGVLLSFKVLHCRR